MVFYHSWDLIYEGLVTGRTGQFGTSGFDSYSNFVWIFLCMHEALCLSRGVDMISGCESDHFANRWISTYM